MVVGVSALWAPCRRESGTGLLGLGAVKDTILVDEQVHRVSMPSALPVDLVGDGGLRAIFAGSVKERRMLPFVEAGGAAPAAAAGEDMAAESLDRGRRRAVELRWREERGRRGWEATVHAPPPSPAGGFARDALVRTGAVRGSATSLAILTSVPSNCELSQLPCWYSVRTGIVDHV